jgi:hypothetical protein
MKNSTQTEKALDQLSDDDLDNVTGGGMRTPKAIIIESMSRPRRVEFWVAPRITDMDSEMGFKAPRINDMDSDMG